MADRIQNRTMTVFSFQPTQLEMMMKRRHRENAFAGQLETQHLQDDRDRLRCTKTPPTTARSNSCLQQIATTPIIPPIASEPVSPMKTLAGMTIEPEKAEAGADERGANRPSARR